MEVYTKDDVCKALFDAEYVDFQGIKRQAIRFGPEIGTSGVMLPSYFDHRVVANVHKSFKTVIGALTTKIRDSGANYNSSSADAGIPYGSTTALLLDRGSVTVRKNGNLAGYVPEGSIVDLVDDLNTSGKTAVFSTEALEKVGVTPNAIYVVVNRQKNTDENQAYLVEQGLSIESLVTETDLIEYGRKIKKISDTDMELIDLANKNYTDFVLQVIADKPAWIKEHRHALAFLQKKDHLDNPKICQGISDRISEKKAAGSSSGA